MWRCLYFVVLLPWAGVSHALETQSFVLSPGWNLVTFQVLPASPQASHVFSSMVASDGRGARLFDPENPAGSRLDAAFALDSVQVVGQETHLTWRAFQAARFNDLKSLPSGFPLPEIEPGQVHRQSSGALSQLAFGEAYLILVRGISQEQSFEVTGEALAIGTVGETNLAIGWNLVGFPFDITIQDKPRLNIASFFPARALSKLERVAKWDSLNARFRSYFPAKPEQSGFRFVEPSMGYWIYAKEAIILDPKLVVGAPGDLDLGPLQENPVVRPGQPWNPGPEDVESSPPGVPPIFDTVATQDWLRISRHEFRLSLPLYNAGGGVVGWTADVMPFSGSVPDGSVALDSEAAVDDVFSLSAPHGLASADETRVLEVSLNRRHLPPATYLAELVIKSSVGEERLFNVAVEVGGLEGQWVGSVNINTANGRRNAVPEIDVHLHISADALEGSRLLRGFIDGRETLLWQSDAPFLGQVLEPRRSPRWRRSYRKRFVIEGGLTLAPGDLNRFPFDRFPDPRNGQQPDVSTATDPVTGLEYRTNQDGDRHYFTLPGREYRADFSNPTPWFVARYFQFLGAEVIPDGNEPLVSGRYVETVTGLLNRPIRLEGRFQLRRVSSTPYEGRPLLAFFGTPSGANANGLSNKIFEAPIEIEVEDDLLIQRALVIVALAAADRTHELVLTAPDGTALTLHGRDNIDLAKNVIFDSGQVPIDANELLGPPESHRANRSTGVEDEQIANRRYEAHLREAIGSYKWRLPGESLGALHDRRAAGTWTLSTHGGENMPALAIDGWSLVLLGPPIKSLAGEVVVSGEPASDPYGDVKLDVVGLPATLSEKLVQFDRSNGRFEVDHVPGMRIDILASKPGFVQAGISGLGAADHPRGFRDNLEGFLAGGPGSGQLEIVLRPKGVPPSEGSAVDHIASAAEGGAVTLESTPYRLIQGGFGFAGRASGDSGTIHYMVGGHIANLGVSQYEGLDINASTDGEYRISTGAAPGIDPRIH